MTYSTQLDKTEITLGQTRLVAHTHLDVSPEILLESLARVDAAARAAGQKPQTAPMTARFRKRLAGVRG